MLNEEQKPDPTDRKLLSLIYHSIGKRFQLRNHDKYRIKKIKYEKWQSTVEQNIFKKMNEIIIVQ